MLMLGACCAREMLLQGACCLHVELRDMGSAGKMSCSATAMALNIAGPACAADSHCRSIANLYLCCCIHRRRI